MPFENVYILILCKKSIYGYKGVECNLPKEGMQTLKELVKLEREMQIVIKQCDKGAGIMIIDFDDYIKAAKDHPEEEMKDNDGNKKPYYKTV